MQSDAVSWCSKEESVSSIMNLSHVVLKNLLSQSEWN